MNQTSLQIILQMVVATQIKQVGTNPDDTRNDLVNQLQAKGAVNDEERQHLADTVKDIHEFFEGVKDMV